MFSRKPKVRPEQVQRLVKATHEKWDAGKDVFLGAPAASELAYRQAIARYDGAHRNSTPAEIQAAMELAHRNRT